MPEFELTPGTDVTGTARLSEDMYVPSEEEKKIIAEVDRKFKAWRQIRSKHEPQWYVNAAFFRGNHNVHWSSIDNRLISAPLIHPNRTKKQINRVFAKVRARRSKFLKNRPTWVVIPASTDSESRLNARATSRVLDYVYRKAKLEWKYRKALEWAETCSRGYWWFSWDSEALGRVSQVNELTQEKQVVEAVVGDIVVEAGSPFEVLVGDPSAASLAEQEEVIRVKERSIDYVKARFGDTVDPETGETIPGKAQHVTAESTSDAFQYQAQIANLNATGDIFGTSETSLSEQKRDKDDQPTTVLVKEHFKRPCHEYPKGRYVVVVNGILVKQVNELPFGLYNFENPFPCVEFPDVTTAGQYWGPTVVEQLVELQREYNGIRTMISANLKLMGHPKIMVAKQHQLPEGAWTPDAGEIIEFNARPGIPPPAPWMPTNISADAWRSIELLKSEFDDITQIFPSSEGKSGQSQSGFQTNLLQEASDAAHAPDIRLHEMAIEEAAYKIRRIIKLGYDIPRLITVTANNYEPEIFEFSSDNIDEYAEIIVQAGSALPMLKGAKIQSVLDLYAKGVLGHPQDPEVRKKVLNVLDLGGMEEIYESTHIDDDMINVENATAEDGKPLAEPRFYENHQAHWLGHINRLKSPSIMYWQPDARMGLLAHAILHAAFINPQAAYQMSIEAGLEGLIPPPPPVPMMGPPGMEPPQQGQPGQPAQQPSADHSFNEMNAIPPQS